MRLGVICAHRSGFAYLIKGQTEPLACSATPPSQGLRPGYAAELGDTAEHLVAVPADDDPMSRRCAGWPRTGADFLPSPRPVRTLLVQPTDGSLDRPTYDRLVLDDELPADVFTELGRVTWAAIRLEDYTESLCQSIDPANPRTDKRLIGQKIKDAQRVLTGWPVSPARDVARAWLERSRVAIERRNATLHATPVVWLAPGHPQDGRQLLREMPRKNRPYREWPLTVESLGELLSVLTEAASGWRDVVIAAGSEWRRLCGTGGEVNPLPS